MRDINALAPVMNRRGVAYSVAGAVAKPYEAPSSHHPLEVTDRAAELYKTLAALSPLVSRVARAVRDSTARRGDAERAVVGTVRAVPGKSHEERGTGLIMAIENDRYVVASCEAPTDNIDIVLPRRRTLGSRRVSRPTWTGMGVENEVAVIACDSEWSESSASVPVPEPDISEWLQELAREGHPLVVLRARWEEGLSGAARAPSVVGGVSDDVETSPENVILDVARGAPLFVEFDGRLGFLGIVVGRGDGPEVPLPEASGEVWDAGTVAREEAGFPLYMPVDSRLLRDMRRKRPRGERVWSHLFCFNERIR